MTASAYPLLVDALVALAEPVVPAGVTVSDGMPTADDGADFLAVGVPSLSETGPIYSGSARQDWATVGGQGARDEAGEIRCIAAARSTDESVKDARDRAQAIVEAVSALCLDTPDLGVEQCLWTSCATSTDWGLLYETGQPTAAFVEFTIGYKARL
jgi:hypothetical protein